MCLLKVFVQKSIPRTTLPGIDFSAFSQTRLKNAGAIMIPGKVFPLKNDLMGIFLRNDATDGLLIRTTSCVALRD